MKDRQIRTRWSPTLNGALHVGHIFSLLVNERFAHENGGEFHIRFDDTSPPAVELPADRMENIYKEQLYDIAWLDIDVDYQVKQSELVEKTGNKFVRLGYEFLPEEEKHTMPLFIRLGSDFVSYPYVPQQIAERVVMDYHAGITHIIRGEDFSTEYSLYCYYCQIFEFPRPEFIYLPRLMSRSGDISKTNGGYKVSEFRGNGYTNVQLKDMIAQSCLIYPLNGWKLHNIKSNPVFIR